MIIKEVSARAIFDSRGDETIEVSVNGCRASAPSGKSIGKYETKPYQTSLKFSLDEINSLKFDFEVDSFDGLKKVEKFICKKFSLKEPKQFGANALFALESAILKALAKAKNKSLWQIINPKAGKFPVPVGNAVGGGRHSEKFKVHPAFQEFLIIPNEKTFAQNVKTMKEIYAEIGKILGVKDKNDEGAWQAPLQNAQVIEILSKFSKKIRIGIDAAASSLYKSGLYHYNTKSLDQESQIKYMNNLIMQHNLFYLEDPLHEDDFMGFSRIEKKNLVVGDDLTATHISRLKEAIKNNSINAMIIKPNQNGSLLELQKIFKICRDNGIKTIMSHRSGETMDGALADYAFAFEADFIKTGISTAWREAKLNRMIEIEESFK